MDDHKVVAVSKGRESLSRAPVTEDGITGGRSSVRRTRTPAIEEIKQRVYRFPELAKYSTRDRLLIRTADLSLFMLIKLVCKTLRWQVRGMEHLDFALTGGHRVIFTSWHSCLFCATWFWRHRGIVVMSSWSRDGEFTGRIIKRFGFGTARGSSSRGSGRALAEMAHCLDGGIDVGFTIDGPRGPAYVAKSGAVTLAKHTGQAVLPFHIATRRYITIPSWDRMEIPLPFSPAIALIAPTIHVRRDASPDEVAAAQESLQASLDALRREAELWRHV